MKRSFNESVPEKSGKSPVDFHRIMNRADALDETSFIFCAENLKKDMFA